MDEKEQGAMVKKLNMAENAKTKGDEDARNNLWERCELKQEETVCERRKGKTWTFSKN